MKVPAQWHTQFRDCSGRTQSPVNIDKKHVLYSPDLKAFNLSSYAEARDVELINYWGHTGIGLSGSNWADP